MDKMNKYYSYEEIYSRLCSQLFCIKKGYIAVDPSAMAGFLESTIYKNGGTTAFHKFIKDIRNAGIYKTIAAATGFDMRCHPQLDDQDNVWYMEVGEDMDTIELIFASYFSDNSSFITWAAYRLVDWQPEEE